MAVVVKRGTAHDARDETKAMYQEPVFGEEGGYKAPKFRTAAHQILNNSYFRRRMIVHKPVIDPETGVWDHHAGKEINPAGSERAKRGPRQD